ncbi:MAG TPA: bifunctional diaminohydroxyphosphoribosylaminopyrimidine deaminase/5-amino-6-(5-phosphoribosylamino)uracil reductase RibD [Dongiaceae bacterium]|nr:bifunctional diaminohydroxyphosphoribosylaminopyrimidine deaminase/5-amino-6-(5-phosphoribosylamino)uracil reductase RibD [Dongiaceae bacterium]
MSASSTNRDKAFIEAAIGLARRAQGLAWPNPPVGCVICDADGRVLGRGHTQQGGRPHAEQVALAQAGAAARGGTAYVTLEPCNHHGQTPPCTEALIGAGLSRVVFCDVDPDPRTQGAGAAALRAAGVAVDHFPHAHASEVNAGFLTRVEKGRPQFLVKIAATADGRIALANGSSQWITNEDSRRLVHRWRAEMDGILTTGRTVVMDDPRLTCRLPGLSSPRRLVLDARLGISLTAALLQDCPAVPLILLASPSAEAKKVAAMRDRGVEVIFCGEAENGRIDLDDMARKLGEAGYTRIMVEAGPRLVTALCAAGLADRLLWFQAPKLMGGDSMPALQALGLERLDQAIRLEEIEAGRAGLDEWRYYRIL